jgi:hypothetical protein
MVVVVVGAGNAPLGEMGGALVVVLSSTRLSWSSRTARAARLDVPEQRREGDRQADRRERQEGRERIPKQRPAHANGDLAGRHQHRVAALRQARANSRFARARGAGAVAGWGLGWGWVVCHVGGIAGSGEMRRGA